MENVNYCRRYVDLSEGLVHRERAEMKDEKEKQKRGRGREE